ncbi:GNAT family N-acetyltransferase [Aeromonas dhakensis]|uniref:GNAT family N-acetyltransferase n=1 Tax=Aeromonas dhakensis TaxID=196024 RepID=UPI00036EBDDF|nr:GNAT family N-acetyltransferase [Aeromonas dhakensis]
MPTELRQLQASDAPALQRLFELAPAYQAAISHAPLCAQAAEEALTACPPTLPFSAKRVIGCWEAGELTAVLDLLRGYPEPTTAYLGLLLVGELWQGAGRGQALYLHACTLARAWGATRLRLSVIASNEVALSFWQRRGFTECYRRELAGYRAEAIVLECAIDPAPSGHTPSLSPLTD